MILIVGLGNPGKNYKNTRHNTGFLAIDEFAQKNYFSDFRLSKKFNTEISEGVLSDQKIILAKPQTFMNFSGKSAKKLIRNWKLEIKNLIVIHDDIDLPLGKIKIVKNRGSAGHKGVESIIKELKTKNFIRFRIGIRPQRTYGPVRRSTEEFVLKKFGKEEEKIIKEVVKKSVEVIETFLKQGLEKAMNEYNK